jgi:hypothetical protein
MRCFKGNVKEMPKLFGDSLGNVFKSSWRPFEKYLKSIGDSLGNAQRVLEIFSATADTFWEMPK